MPAHTRYHTISLSFLVSFTMTVQWWRKHLAGWASAIAQTLVKPPCVCWSVLCRFGKSFLDLQVGLPALARLPWHLGTCGAWFCSCWYVRSKPKCSSTDLGPKVLWGFFHALVLPNFLRVLLKSPLPHLHFTWNEEEAF